METTKDIAAIDMASNEDLRWANKMFEHSNHVLAADNQRLREEVERLKSVNAILRMTIDNMARKRG